MGGSTKTLEELEKVAALAVEVTKDFHRGAHLHQRLLREEQVCDFAAHTLQLPSRHQIKVRGEPSPHCGWDVVWFAAAREAAIKDAINRSAEPRLPRLEPLEVLERVRLAKP